MSTSLAELLHEQLRDLFDAQEQYRGLLPCMVENCTHTDLALRLREIQETTAQNRQDLLDVCQLLKINPDGVTCEAMQGLIRETCRSATGIDDSATMDAALIANAQRIAHYEIAGFGTASAFARCISAHEAAAALAQITERAANIDQRLTRIAQGGWFTPGINHEAAIAE